MKFTLNGIIDKVSYMHINNVELIKRSEKGFVVKQYDNTERKEFRMVSIYFNDGDFELAYADSDSWKGFMGHKTVKTYKGVISYLNKYLVIVD